MLPYNTIYRCESLSNLLPLTHWKQLADCNSWSFNCCESLSNLLPLTHWKQHSPVERRWITELWIAFKFITFDTLETTGITIHVPTLLLWIAFKFITFDTLETTNLLKISKIRLLWIAFKFITFDTLETTLINRKNQRSSCESLSNLLPLTHWKQHRGCGGRFFGVVNRFQIYYLWHIGNNRLFDGSFGIIVVNRFQIYYLWHIGNNTTLCSTPKWWLWIAFKFITFDTLETTTKD